MLKKIRDKGPEQLWMLVIEMDLGIQSLPIDWKSKIVHLNDGSSKRSLLLTIIGSVVIFFQGNICTQEVEDRGEKTKAKLC